MFIQSEKRLVFRSASFYAAFCSKFVLEYISIGIPLQLLIAGQMEILQVHKTLPVVKLQISYHTI